MKQSLEKLHSGIGVPELQHNAPDEPPAETQAEDWVFWSSLTSAVSKLVNLDKCRLCSFFLLCNWQTGGNSEL